MATDVIQHEELRSERAPDHRGAPAAPTTSRRPQWKTLLRHWSILLAMTNPEAVIALSYGVPNLDDDTLVRLLSEHRLGY